MRWRAGTERNETATRGDGFVNNNGAFWQRGAERLPQAVQCKFAGGPLGSPRLNNTRWFFVQGPQFGGQRIERCNRIALHRA